MDIVNIRMIFVHSADERKLTLGQVVSCVSQVAFVVAVLNGLGAHQDTLSPLQIVTSLHSAWISMILGIVSIAVGKLAIIAFLEQLRGRHGGRSAVLWFLGISNVILNSVCWTINSCSMSFADHVEQIAIVLICIQCSPIDKLWDSRIQGKCTFMKVNQKFAFFQGSM